MVDFIVTYCKAGLLWFSAFNSSSLLLLLAAVQLMAFCALWRWRWRDYYLPRKYFLCAEDDARVPAAAPLLTARPVKASIVIPCYNSGKVLEEHLSAILEQNFDDYEVIVVDEASTDDTRIVLQQLEARYKHLRHTFVPDSARYVSRAKLAVTLGIRSARSPWVVLTTPDSLPRGNNWLSTLAAHFSDEVDFVLGCATYGRSGAGSKRAVYERLRRQLLFFRAARSGRAVGADRANMAVRREWFLANKGYEDSLASPYGEDELLVAALSREGRTSLALHPDAVVEEEFPGKETVREERICRREVMRHWSRRGRLFLLREGGATFAAYVMLLSSLFYIGVRLSGVFGLHEPAVWHYATDACVLLVGLLAFFFPYGLLRRTLGLLELPRFNVLFMIWRGLAQPWNHLSQKFSRWRRRHEFVRR